MKKRAFLSSQGPTTSFSFGDSLIRFRASNMLEKYVRVKEWDKGYLVVDALYSGVEEPVEEYIDLVPILENLYRDPGRFCNPIKEVVLE